MLRSDQRLPEIERINIYVNAYFYRLLECLNEEYPATLAVLGADDFAGLSRTFKDVRPINN
jgi:hypothetical protein